MRNLIAAVLLLLVAPTSRAQVPFDAPEMKSTAPGKAQASRAAKASGTVTAMDRAARTVTIQSTGGPLETFKVGPEVKRFDEVAVGDTVAVEFQQGLTLELQQPGEKPVGPEVITGGERSDKDRAPGGSIATWVRATVTVTAIDLKSRTVAFQGPKGQSHQVTAGPTIKLEKLKVGDKLIATYFEALAITLEKAPATPAKAKPGQEAAPARK
jgi:hypothetical protein